MRYGRYEFTAMHFWVDQCTNNFDGRNESGARVAFEDEFGAAEEREVSCEAQQGRSGVKKKLFRSCRNNMGNEQILASPEGSENFVILMVGDVRTLIMEEAYATKYSVRHRWKSSIKGLRVYCNDLTYVGARVAFEDEFGVAEEREVSCEAQQGRSGVKKKLFRSCRNNMGNEQILASPEGSENFVVMRGARDRMLA
nr:hypothetical protein [Tanacetum cinerariifolium]